MLGSDNKRRSPIGWVQRTHPVVKRRIDVCRIEQRGDIWVSGLSGGDLVRMNAAEDQQVVVRRKIAQRLDRCSYPFIFVDKTENADEYDVSRQLVEQGKAVARGALSDGSRFG